MAATPRPILVVDDNPDDLFITCWIISQAGIENPIVTMNSGEDAIGFLGDCLGTDWMPCVVLLDIKMPEVDGFDVLAWARSRSQLASVSFIMLTTSNLPEDQARAAALGAAGYITKYDRREDLQKLMQHCLRVSVPA
jgi:CheY-like chemotaxis protein